MSDQRFDWYPLLKTPFIDKLVHELYPKAQPKRSGVNVDKVFLENKQIATVIISSLYQAYSSPNCVNTISYPKRAKAYKLNHQTLIPYSRTRADDVFKKLKSLKWIKVTDAIRNEKYTRIEASGELKDIFDDIGFVWFPQRPLQRYRSVLMRDVVRNKDGKVKKSPPNFKPEKDWVNVEQTKEVKNIQESLYKINSFLSKQCITLDLNDKQLSELVNTVTNTEQDAELFDLRRIQLVRIFSRGSMGKGGRFYRGWWQNIPSIHRPHIRINGKKTIEVDYSGMHLNMLYALCGIEYPYGKDPYDLGLQDWMGKEDSRRKAIKRAFNAILNDEEGTYRLEKEYEAIISLSNDEFHQKLKDTHPEIYQEIQSDIGLRLQKLDSDIAEDVLLQLTSLSIPCLPVHDSFIVTASNELLLIDLLKNTFRKYLGVDIKVDVDVVKSRDSFGLPNSSIKDIPPSELIYSGESLWEEVVRRDISLMDDYLRSYKDYHS